MGFLALENRGFLAPDKVGLGIAAGHEAIAFALTKHCREIHAIDLYGDTSFAGSEANREILSNPRKFWSFEFDPTKIKFRHMDARKLEYADNTFDFAFSFSSIEHFGRDQGVRKSMEEAYRVLKPGGLYVLSVDWIFRESFPHLPRSMRWREAGEFLTSREVKKILIESTPFVLKDQVFFETDPVDNLFDVLTKTMVRGTLYPHIHLQFRKWLLRKYYFTSLFMAFHKPE
jgi:ubiquinone/menaquinone biosynthesis C-methylase UbiE